MASSCKSLNLDWKVYLGQSFSELIASAKVLRVLETVFKDTRTFSARGRLRASAPSMYLLLEVVLVCTVGLRE